MMRTDILWDIYKGVNILKEEFNKGDIFETISHIAILTKGLFNYKSISNTHISNEILNPIMSCKELFNVKLHQGNNPSDITPIINDKYTAFTIKYLSGYGEYDLNRLNTVIQKSGGNIGLIVKDKRIVIDHKFNHHNYPDKKLLDNIIKNNLLFDEEDINNAINMFQRIISKLKFNDVDELMEWMDEYYLSSKRCPLTLKVHQQLALRNFKLGMFHKENIFMLSHKPRSGKTITLLYKAKLLLTSYKKDKILLITSVPSTIESFIRELDKYNDFKNIKYKTQDDFLDIDDNYKGIIFCSVQYLKNDKKNIKCKKIVSLNLDAIIPDESHFGISTEKTSNDILDLYKDKKIICIFSSGTSLKTERYYNIKKMNISRWDIEDEICMNNLNETNMIIMNERHGSYFKHCLGRTDLDKNYSKCPKMILLQPTISIDMIKKMDNYNKEHNTDYGYHCSSFLSLEHIKRNKKKDIKYNKKFQLDTNNSGRKYLIAFLKMIINDDPMEDCIMKQIQDIQNRYKSRSSTEKDPLLFLMYLPYGQNIGTISLIQETLKKFLEDNELWTSYHVCYSSSKQNSGDDNTTYQRFVNDELEKTKKLGKEGCILLLGDQGTLGITYPKCDVTISLDNGTNIDAQKQRNYRAGTEADGKIIGINVDLNIQRVLKYSRDVINRYRSLSNDKQGMNEIQQYLFKEGLFIVNPHEYQFGDNHETMIKYFDKLSTNYRMNIDIDTILDDIDCDDYLNKLITLNKDDYIINKSLQGKQPDCNKGSKNKEKVDNLCNDSNNKSNVDGGYENDNFVNNEIGDDYISSINKTVIVNKTITKFSVLVLRIDRKNPVNSSMSNIELLILLLDKEDEFRHIGNKLHILFGINQSDLKNIYLNYINTMKSSDKHIEIIDDMFEKLSNATPGELRILIDELYKPSKSEEHDNAEIPTSKGCVDYGLNWINDEWFTKPKKVGEITCGKGNFVLGLFEKFYKGLQDYEPDPLKRCILIIQECIYFADIEWSNVFITRSLLISIAVDMMPKDTDWDILIDLYEIKCNEYVGNTLELNCKDVWGIDHFDAFVGNPPYQERNKNGKSKHGKSNLWTKFIEYSFKNLKPNGLLLYITPSSWMGGTVGCYKNMIKKQIVNLNVNECKKYFPKIGSTFSYYLIENKDIYKSTKVICKYDDKIYKNEIMLSKEIKILPQLLTREMISIMNKVCIWSQDKLFIRKDILSDNTTWRSENVSSEKNDICKYPFLAYIQTDGNKDIQYCKNKMVTQDYKKVMLFRHGYLNPTYDDGENGVGNNIHYAKVENKNEGERLLGLFKSDLYNFIFSICKTSQFTNGRVMNWLYRKNPIYEDINSYFKLTNEEIAFIHENK